MRPASRSSRREMAVSQERSGSVDQSTARVAAGRTPVIETSRYDLVSVAWMAFLTAVAGAILMMIMPQTIVGSAISKSVEMRDDAQAMIVRYGFPEIDSATDPTSAQDARVLTYKNRRLRATFVRRTTAAARPAWKLSGFLELDSDGVL